MPLRLPFTTQDNKRQLFRLLQKIAREADHIVTVSENSKRDIIELLGVEEARITNTYQTVEFPQEWIERPIAAVANQLEATFGLELHELPAVLRCVGAKKKCPPVDRRLFDLGGRYSAGSRRRRGLAERCRNAAVGRAEERSGAEAPRRGIHRLDYVSFSNLVTLIRGARAVIFPSLYEGFGLPVLEVDGSRHAGRRVARILAAGDRRRCRAARRSLTIPMQIARAIATIVNDGDLRAELSRAGTAARPQNSRSNAIASGSARSMLRCAETPRYRPHWIESMVLSRFQSAPKAATVEIALRPISKRRLALGWTKSSNQL